MRVGNGLVDRARGLVELVIECEVYCAWTAGVNINIKRAQL